MKLSFYGAARSVTGSRHLLEMPGFRLLFDCGLFQGRREEALQQNRDLGFDPKSLSAVLLSHAHIDHCGNIPVLIKKGLRCNIYTTAATRDLCKLMLADSGKTSCSPRGGRSSSCSPGRHRPWRRSEGTIVLTSGFEGKGGSK